MNFITEVLHSGHNRSNFNCGNENLNQYLKIYAGQDMKRKLSVCFVWNESKKIIGFYTISSMSISNASLPVKFAKKLSKSYSELPVILIGRLAIDLKFQGKGFGKILLIDALYRSYYLTQNKIGSVAVVIDPVDVSSRNFYLKFGFIELIDSKRLFLPMKTIQSLF